MEALKSNGSVLHALEPNLARMLLLVHHPDVSGSCSLLAVFPVLCWSAPLLNCRPEHDTHLCSCCRAERAVHARCAPPKSVCQSSHMSQAPSPPVSSWQALIRLIDASRLGHLANLCEPLSMPIVQILPEAALGTLRCSTHAYTTDEDVSCAVKLIVGEASRQWDQQH